MQGIKPGFSQMKLSLNKSSIMIKFLISYLFIILIYNCQGNSSSQALNIADNLSRYFGTKVQIKRRGQRGKVEIEFYNNDDLNRLIDLLGKT